QLPSSETAQASRSVSSPPPLPPPSSGAAPQPASARPATPVMARPTRPRLSVIVFTKCPPDARPVDPGRWGWHNDNRPFADPCTSDGSAADQLPNRDRREMPAKRPLSSASQRGRERPRRRRVGREQTGEVAEEALPVDALDDTGVR